MQTYTAHYTREGSAWVVLFDEIELSTFGRTIAVARRNAREALAVFLGTTPQRLKAHIDDQIDDPAAQQAEEVVRDRERAEEISARVAAETGKIVRALRRKGWSQTDIAEILRITPQAVSSRINRTRPAAMTRGIPPGRGGGGGSSR